MPKNAKKGKNAKAKSEAVSKREFVTATEDQQYAKVNRMLGDRRVECEFVDGTTILGRIRKTMQRGGKRNGNFMEVGDIVLVALRDFQADKVDIIHLYKKEEVKRLIHMGEQVPQTNEQAEDVIRFEFGDSDLEEDSD